MPNLRLKIRDFLKKNKKTILIIIGIWILVIVINYILGHLPEGDFVPITTYEPHASVMDESSTVPEKLQNPIEEKIKEFITACNEKDYEKAFNLLSAECKENVYKNDIENFKLYVDYVFDGKKIYNIQNWSNKNKNYIYTVTILEDIMATGLTGTDSLDTYEETFSLKDENGELKLSIRGYIENQTIDKMYEDDYLKITIDDVKVEYETITYSVKIKNKTDGIIVMDDFSGKYEIAIKINGEYRKRAGFYVEPVIIERDETRYFDFSFPKFYDEKSEVQSLILNDIRILKTYTGTEETRQDELDNAIARYGLELELNK